MKIERLLQEIAESPEPTSGETGSGAERAWQCSACSGDHESDIRETERPGEYRAPGYPLSSGSLSSIT